MKTIISVCLVLLSCGCSLRQNSHELPMFGGGRMPFPAEVAPDQIAANKTSSRELSKLGWEYFYQHDFDTAIKRFNQAWLFDPANPEVWWGFGLITGIRADKEEQCALLNVSICYLEKALDLDKANTKIMVDLAISYTKLGEYLQIQKQDKSQLQFEKAETLFVKAQNADASFAPLWLNWAYLRYYQKDYRASYEFLNKAKGFGIQVPDRFVRDLRTAAGY